MTTQSQPEPVAVTEADRSAALSLVRKVIEMLQGDTLADPASVDPFFEAFARHRHQSLAEVQAEIVRLREENERLRKMTKPQWFYAPDGYESDYCRDSPDEVIEDFDLRPGRHVVEVHCATNLPSIWCAVEVLTGEEMNERETDEGIIIREFATEAEARAALQETPRHDVP